MTAYTLQTQFSTDGGATWGPVEHAENIDDTLTPTEIIEQTGWPDPTEWDLPPYSMWRIGIWIGHLADTATTPAAVLGPCWAGTDELVPAMPPADLMLQELLDIRTRRRLLAARRDELVRHLMNLEPRVARSGIAVAAGVGDARLYQIRDGRR